MRKISQHFFMERHKKKKHKKKKSVIINSPQTTKRISNYVSTKSYHKFTRNSKRFRG